MISDGDESSRLFEQIYEYSYTDDLWNHSEKLEGNAFYCTITIYFLEKVANEASK